MFTWPLFFYHTGTNPVELPYVEKGQHRFRIVPVRCGIKRKALSFQFTV